MVYVGQPDPPAGRGNLRTYVEQVESLRKPLFVLEVVLGSPLAGTHSHFLFQTTLSVRLVKVQVISNQVLYGRSPVLLTASMHEDAQDLEDSTAFGGD